MNRIAFILLLFFSSLSCYGQNRAIPKAPILSNEALLLKYGEDKKNWPLWAIDSAGLNNGIDLNSLSLDAVTCDGTKIEFDDTLDFNNLNSALNFRKVMQNGFTFAYINEKWILATNVMKKDITAPIQCSIKSNGIELNELSTIKEKFPKSYNWRDRYPNMLKSVIPEGRWNDMVLLMFDISDSDDTLQLFYYQEKLFLINRDIISY
ncbi:hypothetical protein [Roseivirga sp.]|uniref:hypothetical protein n=1 Tax=Roseivirga sp. TaxID=1964215 RepID=UPI002B26AB41|nr:hypothetical protein [Roseivirga sp.]